MKKDVSPLIFQCTQNRIQARDLGKIRNSIFSFILGKALIPSEVLSFGETSKVLRKPQFHLSLVFAIDLPIGQINSD
jgi:hypothetical protein